MNKVNASTISRLRQIGLSLSEIECEYESVELQNLVEEYVKLEKEWDEISNKFKRLDNKLDGLIFKEIQATDDDCY